LCPRQVRDFVGNLLRTLSQSRRNGIWAVRTASRAERSAFSNGYIAGDESNGLVTDNNYCLVKIIQKDKRIIAVVQFEIKLFDFFLPV